MVLDTICDIVASYQILFQLTFKQWKYGGEGGIHIHTSRISKTPYHLGLRLSTNLPFLLQRKAEGRLIGFLYASLQKLYCICLLVFRTCQTKLFDINSEHIKRINCWAKYIQKTFRYLNLFTDFNLFSCISRNGFFCASQPAQ